VRVPAGKSRDRFGNPMTTKIKGTVEAYFDDVAAKEKAAAAEAPKA